MDAFARAVLFWGVCIPVRTALAGLAWAARDKWYLRYVALLALVPVVSFFALFFRASAGAMGAFGGPVWWGRVRIVHSALYTAFLVLAFLEPRFAAFPLFADVVVAASAAMALAP